MNNLPMLMSQIPFYSDRNSLQAVAGAILSQAPSLRPQVTSFNAGNNQSIILFHINGPLNVSVRGFPDFTVPIAIFFDPPFPRVAPRIFVTAPPGTTDLEIVPNHSFVEASGLVKLPSAWDGRRPGDLPGILASAMSSECPIYPPPAMLARVLDDSMVAAMESVAGRISLAEATQAKLEERNSELKKHESRLKLKYEELQKKNQFLTGLSTSGEAVKVDPMTTLKFHGNFLGATAAEKIAEVAALEDYAVVLEDSLRQGFISISEFLPEFRNNSAKIFEARAICNRAVAALHLAATKTS